MERVLSTSIRIETIHRVTRPVRLPSKLQSAAVRRFEKETETDRVAIEPRKKRVRSPSGKEKRLECFSLKEEREEEEEESKESGVKFQGARSNVDQWRSSCVAKLSEIQKKRKKRKKTTNHVGGRINIICAGDSLGFFFRRARSYLPRILST